MMDLLGNLGTNRMLVISALVLGGALVIISNGIPLGDLVPLALLILCPLMHLLMMRGHGAHGGGNQASCHETKALPAEVTTRKEGSLS